MAATASVPLNIRRLPIKLVSNEQRVITLPFASGDEQRARHIFGLVGQLSDAVVDTAVKQLVRDFGSRHQDITKIFGEHYATAASLVGAPKNTSAARRFLIGAYVTKEYSIEAAALFNPSIAPHPDQRGVADGGTRFVMSLRATGEGHVSSIVFHTGIIDANHDISLDTPARFSSRARLAPDQFYLKPLFHRKLGEMGVRATTVERILNGLPTRFTFAQLKDAIKNTREEEKGAALFQETVESLLLLARSNYQLKLPPQADVSDAVIYPVSDNESRGIEDLRLVRFIDDDDTATYYGTYTAYNGIRILPMLLHTQDFREIHCHTLNGACARNKGMALFPRRINGHYAMVSRIDGQNLYIMYSDYVHFWESATLLAAPAYPWQFVKIGNCGSPLETSEGWLLLTHGVGPMRRYCIGAMLLDLDNPLRIIGRLREPILAPTEDEREGYVPNVVYSCGAMIHRERLILPYAMSDRATSLATIDLDELLDLLRRSGP